MQDAKMLLTFQVCAVLSATAVETEQAAGSVHLESAASFFAGSFIISF